MAGDVRPLKDRPLPTEVMDLIRDSEKLVIALQAGGRMPVNYVAILSKDTAAVDKFKAAAGLWRRRSDWRDFTTSTAPARKPPASGRRSSPCRAIGSCC